VDVITTLIPIVAAILGCVGVYFQYTRPARLKIESNERIEREKIQRQLETEKLKAVADSHEDIKGAFDGVITKVERIEEHQKRLAAIVSASMSERLVYLLDLYIGKGECSNYQFKAMEAMYREYSDKEGLIKGNGLVAAKWEVFVETVRFID